MTTRDRLMLMGLLALALLGAAWFLAVAPERKQATELDAQVSAARQQLSTAQAQLAEAQGAQAQYASAYASVVRLGEAVPADQEIPSLVYELDQASNQKDVNFTSITAGSSGGASSSTSPSAAAKAAAASGGFTQMPFTFVFKGSFFDLEHLLAKLDSFTLSGDSSGLRVSGRLLTIQGASLQLVQKSGAGEGATTSKPSGSSHEKEGELTGTITATAYVLAAGQGLTGGATPAGPAGSAAQPVSSSGASSSATTPAVVRVNP
jgi:type II secretory pathway pseudopilin PulG